MTAQEDEKLRLMAQRISEWDSMINGYVPTAMSKHVAKALLAALDRIDELVAKYEGPFVPIKKAKPGDVLGYSQVVYAGRGKPRRLSPEELAELEDDGEVDD